MRTIVLLAALAVASTAWAQEQKKEDTRPAAEEARPAAEQKTKPAPVARKSRRHMDARHCLEKGSNTEIIKCAEVYL